MKTRIIQTKIWQDSFIYGLSTESKLLFIYLITNERLELTGAYEIRIPIIYAETGLSIPQIKKSLVEIESKILYVDNYIIIKNHKKYQDFSKGSEKQQMGFSKELERLPVKIKNLVNNSEFKLVSNQLETSHELVINNKELIIKQKTENINNKYDVFIEKFNSLRNTNYKISNELKKNYDYWNKTFTDEQILQAVENIPNHQWLKTIEYTPTIFLRTNKDWIDQCLNIKKKPIPSFSKVDEKYFEKREARILPSFSEIMGKKLKTI